MTAFLDNKDIRFPAPECTDQQGIIAIGGDFSPERLLAAYRSGIFPWPHPGLPILWFCPDPRFVLQPQKLIINSSLAKEMRKTTLAIVFDENFSAVMRRCQAARRPDQDGTWITDAMIDGYVELHRRGYAHSIEAYRNDKLVGGLYGLALGGVFFGESMFFEESNASKICFATLVAHLIQWNFTLIDCQAHTTHLEQFGGEFVPRSDFLCALKHAQESSPNPHAWHAQMTPLQALLHIRNSRAG